MKIVIDRGALVRGVNAVLDVVPSKTALPVLSSILLEADDSGTVRLQATDLDISIICTLGATVNRAGATTVPARKFAEIIREIPEASVQIEAEDGRVTIQRENGVLGTYALMSTAADEFPELPKAVEGQEMVFGGADEEGADEEDILKDMITKTSFAVSRDETRPVLNGVFWEVGKGRMTMVATDGARLVKYSRKVPASAAPDLTTEAIVPTRALSHLVKLISAGSCLERVHFGQNHLMFDLPAGDGSSSGIRLFTRLVEGPYVDYEQVIPKGNDEELRISNQVLAPAVRRVSILSSSQTHQVRLKLQENQVELSASSQEIGGEAHESVEAEYGGEEMSIGYNSVYLLDILRRIETDTVLFHLDSPVTAGIIRPSDQRDGDDYLCLLMPLRLND